MLDLFKGALEIVKEEAVERKEPPISATCKMSKYDVVQSFRDVNFGRKSVQFYKRLLLMLLSLIDAGEEFSAAEGSELFIHVSKLFELEHATVKRLCHMAVKRLAGFTSDSIMATSSLIKDMNSAEELHRASALRALMPCVEQEMLGSVERYVRQSLVSQNGSFVKAGLLMAYRHVPVELCRKWTNEVNQAFASEDNSIQYLALGLLFKVYADDRFALMKLIRLLGSHCICAHTYILGLRIAKYLLDKFYYNVSRDFSKPANNDIKYIFDFIVFALETHLKAVCLETCLILTTFRAVDSSTIGAMVSLLVKNVFNHNIAFVFSAAKIFRIMDSHMECRAFLSKYCQEGFVYMIKHTNKEVAYVGMLLFMKIANKNNMENCLNHLDSYLSDGLEMHKPKVIDNIFLLITPDSKSNSSIIEMIFKHLEAEKNSKITAAHVNIIVKTLKVEPSMKTVALSKLCSLLEVCESCMLAIKLLKVLTKYSVDTKSPFNYIRQIYVQLSIGLVPVKLTAINCLKKLGHCGEQVKSTVLVILKRQLHDPSDKVRAEAYSALKSLEYNIVFADKNVGKQILSRKGMVDSLKKYIMQQDYTVAFKYEAPEEEFIMEEVIEKEEVLTVSAQQHSQRLTELEGIKELGLLKCSGNRKHYLADEEMEYVVVGHNFVFENHLVVELSVKNTIENHVLEDIQFDFLVSNGYVLEKTILSQQVIKYNETVRFYYILRLPASISEYVTEFDHCSMSYSLLDHLSATRSREVYQVEPISVKFLDFFATEEEVKFAEEWNALGNENVFRNVFALERCSTVLGAKNTVLTLLGVVGEVDESEKFCFCGLFLGAERTAFSLRFSLDKRVKGVVIELALKTAAAELGALLSDVVG